MSNKDLSRDIDKEIDPRSFEECFPDAPCDIEPLGNKVVVQLRAPVSKSRGGIHLVQETKDLLRYNEVIAVVRKVGPLAYHSRGDDGKLVPWGEGPWCQEGDLVRTIKWGGDRYSVPFGDDFVSFIVVHDREIIAKIPDFETSRTMKSLVE